jgi:hypothetical protein
MLLMVTWTLLEVSSILVSYHYDAEYSDREYIRLIHYSCPAELRGL